MRIGNAVGAAVTNRRVLDESPRRPRSDDDREVRFAAEGDPDGGLAPGTPFEDIPDDWYCPVCGARKAEFVPYEG